MNIKNILYAIIIASNNVYATSGGMKVGIGFGADFSKAKVSVKKEIPKELKRLIALLKANNRKLVEDSAEHKTNSSSKKEHRYADDAKNVCKITLDDLWEVAECDKIATYLSNCFGRFIEYDILGNKKLMEALSSESSGAHGRAPGSPAAIAAKIYDSDKLLGELFRIIAEQVPATKNKKWFNSPLRKYFGKKTASDSGNSFSAILKPIFKQIIRAGNGKQILRLFVNKFEYLYKDSNDGKMLGEYSVFYCNLFKPKNEKVLGVLTQHSESTDGESLLLDDIIDFCHCNLNKYNLGLSIIKNSKVTDEQLRENVWKIFDGPLITENLSFAIADIVFHMNTTSVDFLKNYFKGNNRDVEDGSLIAIAESNNEREVGLKKLFDILNNLDTSLRNQEWAKKSFSEENFASVEALSEKLKPVVEKIFKDGNGNCILNLFVQNHDGTYSFEYKNQEYFDFTSYLTRFDLLYMPYKCSLDILKPLSTMKERRTWKKLDGDNLVKKLCQLYSRMLVKNIMYNKSIVNTLKDYYSGAGGGESIGAAGSPAAFALKYPYKNRGYGTIGAFFNKILKLCPSVNKEKWFKAPLEYNFGKSSFEEGVNELAKCLSRSFKIILKKGKGDQLLSIFARDIDGSYYSDLFTFCNKDYVENNNEIDVKLEPFCLGARFEHNSEEAETLNLANSFFIAYKPIPVKSDSKASHENTKQHDKRKTLNSARSRKFTNKKHWNPEKKLHNYYDVRVDTVSTSKKAPMGNVSGLIGYGWILDKWFYEADGYFSACFGKAKIGTFSEINSAKTDKEKISSKDTQFRVSNPWRFGLMGSASYFFNSNIAIGFAIGFELRNIKLNSAGYLASIKKSDAFYNKYAKIVNKNLSDNDKITLIDSTSDIKNFSETKLGYVVGPKLTIPFLQNNLFSICFLIGSKTKVKHLNISATQKSFRIQAALQRVF
ncbi:hypothetical protein FACS1894113_3150 [Alphaproteobacteria bacterium]|nr:hypothetical protein FACS1894113_3150 [Alphaproteobacteria bacterium]